MDSVTHFVTQATMGALVKGRIPLSGWWSLGDSNP